MGRHNTIAGRMASSAAAKGRLFTKLAREIMVSARAGSDLNSNAALRSAVNKAKDNSMPKENIERAIKKGSGEMTGMSFEEITYEGYGPNGSAIMIEVLTDNRNRTHPELRRIFQKNGGNMGEMGVVAWMFKKRGVFVIDSSKVSEDKIMEVALESGAEDIITEDNFTTVYTEVVNFATIREALINADIPFEKAGLELIPDNLVSLSGDNAKQALELVDKLEEHDDVQNVYHNFDIQE
ncbi:YebC/PmpR family DNA-binding transcriptional regulator [Silvanigrella paludirubra]|uniref:Probable transcriptional regulatory protein GCL60_05670 n=1 Tax=Silvanigrella paludirubra TaxID=2499159 RepID=A0A6N6VUL0_9BACT|nr:YebC/PmpR family DNA-binding transcriptional regulator [Silvanigrella paludirubra]KAB8039751.1 YebC/PmpR family DNA-binding transcriptional regulator [Silvanigrella paludirubra]